MLPAIRRCVKYEFVKNNRANVGKATRFVLLRARKGDKFTRNVSVNVNKLAVAFEFVPFVSRVASYVFQEAVVADCFVEFVGVASNPYKSFAVFDKPIKSKTFPKVRFAVSTYGNSKRQYSVVG